MRKILAAGILLATTAGCQTTVGPFQARAPLRVDDPCISIGEQQRRGRDRLALPDESRAVGPPTNTGYRDTWGFTTR